MQPKHSGAGEGASPFTRALAGARLALAGESRAGARLDPAVIKAHTGNAQLAARGVYEGAFTFDVTHKLVLLTNVMPAIDDLDAALRGRIHVVPFDRRWNRPGLPEDERNLGLPDGDKHLAATLAAERPGILGWIVRAAVEYYREGLDPPKMVSFATTRYFAQQDAVGQWVESMERCEPRDGLRPAELHRMFLAWCTENAKRPGKGETLNGLGRALGLLGIDAENGGERRRGLCVPRTGVFQ